MSENKQTPSLPKQIFEETLNTLRPFAEDSILELSLHAIEKMSSLLVDRKLNRVQYLVLNKLAQDALEAVCPAQDDLGSLMIEALAKDSRALPVKGKNKKLPKKETKRNIALRLEYAAMKFARDIQASMEKSPLLTGCDIVFHYWSTNAKQAAKRHREIDLDDPSAQMVTITNADGTVQKKRAADILGARLAMAFALGFAAKMLAEPSCAKYCAAAADALAQAKAEAGQKPHKPIIPPKIFFEGCPTDTSPGDPTIS